MAEPVSVNTVSRSAGKALYSSSPVMNCKPSAIHKKLAPYIMPHTPFEVLM